MIRNARRTLTMGLLLVVAVAKVCPGRADEAFTPVRSSISYRKIGVYDKARLAAIQERDLDAFLAGSTMTRSEFKGTFAAPRHAVTLYEVQFDSVIPEWENEPTVDGGLLAIPDDGNSSHPLLSYQHGTVFGLEEVPPFRQLPQRCYSPSSWRRPRPVLGDARPQALVRLLREADGPPVEPWIDKEGHQEEDVVDVRRGEKRRSDDECLEHGRIRTAGRGAGVTGP